MDFILADGEGNILVGLRTNEPAKGFYFVPGGVIQKNETLNGAFERILETETGIRAQRTDATLLGVFEHFYEMNRLLEPGYGTHYVVLAHALRFAKRPVVLPDKQHIAFKWMSLADLAAAKDVHDNTKAYFR